MPLLPISGGHVHKNMAVLDRLGESPDGGLMHRGNNMAYAGGGSVPLPIFTSQSLEITAQMVVARGFEIDADYDPQKPVTLSLTGSPALVLGADFVIQQHDWPQKDFLSWAGFPDSEDAIMAGNTAVFSYYRRA